jgi:allantoin racemase
MADLCHTLQQRLGAPVIDGMGAAAEGLVALGLETSKPGDDAAPLPKSYMGLAAPYSPR